MSYRQWEDGSATGREQIDGLANLFARLRSVEKGSGLDPVSTTLVEARTAVGLQMAGQQKQRQRVMAGRRQSSPPKQRPKQQRPTRRRPRPDGMTPAGVLKSPSRATAPAGGSPMRPPMPVRANTLPPGYDALDLFDQDANAEPSRATPAALGGKEPAADAAERHALLDPLDLADGLGQDTEKLFRDLGSLEPEGVYSMLHKAASAPQLLTPLAAASELRSPPRGKSRGGSSRGTARVASGSPLPQQVLPPLPKTPAAPLGAPSASARVRDIAADPGQVKGAEEFAAEKKKHRHWTSRWTKAVESEKRVLAADARVQGISTKTTLEMAKRALPLEYLNQKNMGSFAAEHALSLIGAFLKKQHKETWAMSLVRWRAFVEDSRQREREKAARVLQSEFRGNETRAWVRESRRKAREKLEAKRSKMAKRTAKLRKAARYIIGTMRFWRFRMAAFEVALQIRSARLLQHAWAAKLTRNEGWSEFAQIMLEWNSGKKIQRIFRGHMGRRRFEKARLIAHHLSIDARFATPHRTMLTNFEYHGAAKKMQKWWTYLPWRCRRRNDRLMLYYTLRLQRAMRGVTAKRKTNKLRKARDAQLEAARVAAAGLLLSRMCRGLVARRKTDKLREEKNVLKAHEEEERHKALEKLLHNPMMKFKSNQGALLIQRMWRGTSARIRVRKLRHEELTLKVRMIQRVYSYRLWYKRRLRSTLRIQRWLRKTKILYAVKQVCVVNMQSKFRQFMANTKFMKWRFEARRIAEKLGPVARRFNARHRQARVDADEYWKAENRLVGEKLFHLTHEDEIKRQILVMTEIDDPELPAETQAAFVYYCSYGSRGNNQRLGVNNFSKMCKDSPNLLGKKVNQQDCELIFTKSLGKLATGGTESHLHYAEFLVALRHVAKLRIPSTTTWGYRLRDDDAKLVRMVQEFILPTAAGKKAAKDLKSQAAPRRADSHIRDAVMAIQRQYRGWTTRDEFLRKRQQDHADKAAAAEVAAAMFMQRMIRGFRGRREAAAKAKAMWEKYVDDESGREYWYNPRTGKATWTKPSTLGVDDIGNPVKMPDEKNAYIVYCTSCGIQTGTTFCFSCREIQCIDCNRIMHSKGRRHDHVSVETETCVQCEFQVGTRYCHTCKDNYCDTCFEDQHSKGMLQLHKYKPLLPPCMECGTRAARRLVHDQLPDKEPIRKLCIPCADEAVLAYPEVKVEFMPYEPFMVLDWYAEKAAEKKRLAIEAEFEERKREAKHRQESRSAVNIQRVFRGSQSRWDNREFVAERKEWLKQRHLDEGKRHQALYMIMLLLGIAPELESDTVYEKVMKRYPVWKKDFIFDVVHSEWTACHKLIEQQEDHQKAQGRTPLSIHSREHAKMLQLKIQVKARRRVEFKARKVHAKAQMAYRNARSTVGFSSEAKDELQQTMRRLHADHEKKKASLTEAEDALNSVKRRRKGRYGPHGMRKRIAEVSEKGWPLPYKASAERARRLVDHPHPAMPPGLKMGDHVKIEGSPNIYRLVQNTGRPSYMESVMLGMAQRKEKLMIWIEGLDPKEDTDKIKERMPVWTFDESELRKLRLNRDWTYAAHAELELRRLPRLPLKQQIARRIREGIKGTIPAQLGVMTTLAVAKKLTEQFRKAANLFDDDSNAYANFLAKSASCEAFVEQTEHMLFKASLPASERVTLVEWVKKMVEQSRTIAKKAYESSKDNYADYQEKKRRKKDPYAKWETSPDQVEVKVSWHDETDTKHIGWLKIDPDCPCTLGREFIHRHLWFELNQRNGTGFLFETKGEPLDIVKEHDKKISSVTPQKLNAETREAEYVMVLRNDPDAPAGAEMVKCTPRDWDAEKAKKDAAKAKKNGKKDDDELDPTKKDKKADDEELWSDDEEGSDEKKFPNVFAQMKVAMKELRTLRGEFAHGDPDAKKKKKANNENEEGHQEGAEVGGVEESKDGEGHGGAAGNEGGTPEWEEAYDEEGNLYYYNNVTGESQYEAPGGYGAPAQEGGYNEAAGYQEASQEAPAEEAAS